MRHEKEISFENYKLTLIADTKLDLISGRIYIPRETDDQEIPKFFSYTLFTTILSSTIFHLNFSADQEDKDRIQEELTIFQNEILLKEIIE